MPEHGKGSNNEGSQSPDIHFREIDGEFLKKQARIWIEAVLNERFDDETSLADLLDDGEILLKVSTIIRGVLKKHADGGEPVSPKSFFPEASFYGKHSGKYLPYSNVDTFLKVCQKLGLSGIDLFSPPDVVEKKDIRRVCLCIRALSKKARARHLPVPEFDFVTHSSVFMPTEYVGGLKDFLRQASSPSSVKDKDSADTVGLSPLHMKRPASDLSSLSQADSEVFDELAKGPARSLNFDENRSRDHQQSEIDPNTPPVVEEDSGFSSGSRSLALSDEEPEPPESSFDDAGTRLGGRKISADTSSEMVSADRSVHTGDDDNHKNPSKKGAWILSILATGLALLGATLLVKPRDMSVYEVKRGDTLSEISRRFGKSSWEELLILNPEIKNPDLIHPHDHLRLHS